MTFPKLLLLLALPFYILDQVTKYWTVKYFPPPWSDKAFDIPIVPDFFHLVRVHNQGVAFGFGNGTAWAPVVFMLVPLLALVMIRLFWLKGVFHHILSKVALALLLCGIFGNLTDRLCQGFLLQEHLGESFWSRLSAGYVVDFIAIKLPYYERLVPASGGWWPSFNVADSCICVAACLLFLGGLRDGKKEEG
jgi:signal peptidase II